MISFSIWFRRLIHNFGNILRSLYILYLRLAGIKIGKDTMISLGAKIDVSHGNISIGNNCLITHGSKILSHDGSVGLAKPGDSGGGNVKIGNNVFVGVNAIILRNVKIGDNSVIGAGSVVTEDVPECSLVIGNPARVIKTLKGPFRIINNPKHCKLLCRNGSAKSKT